MMRRILEALARDPDHSADGVTRCRYCGGTTFRRYETSDWYGIVYGHTVECTGCRVTYLRVPGNQKYFDAIGWRDEDNPPPGH
ncbi:MAG: hypothetical protein M9918_25870 [Anaerolineae bacterium]|nr:hypothetical protein [Anaerolineae bacterium]